MSASENLRALDGAMTPGPWALRAEPPYDLLTLWEETDPVPRGRLILAQNTRHDGAQLAALRNALPLIADLAEHAEQFALAYDERRASEFTDERYEEVLVALELLEKALDGSS